MVLIDSTTSITTVDQWIADKFNNNFGLGGSVSWGNIILCSLAIILSVILCSLIGIEREKRGRSAGLRTHLLVGVGSCVIMIISIYGFPAIFGDRDVARLAAGVVSGVGFLGAGAILHKNGGIKGLTTASTIWIVMAIGLACGSMNFIIAIGTTLVVMVVLVIFRKFEQIVTRSNPMLVILAPSNAPVMTAMLEACKDKHFAVNDVTSQIVQDGEANCVEVTFKLTSENGGKVDPTEFISELEKKIEVKSVQILNHH